MYDNENRDIYVGFLGLSFEEKVVSHLKKSYPDKKDLWQGMFSRVYDAYVSHVNAGNNPFSGPDDNATAVKIMQMTGDDARDVIKVLSAVSAIDKEKITLKHVGIFEKLTSAPGEAVKNALKPIVPFLIPLVGIAAVGAYYYFVEIPKSRMRAIARQKI